MAYNYNSVIQVPNLLSHSTVAMDIGYFMQRSMDGQCMGPEWGLQMNPIQ